MKTPPIRASAAVWARAAAAVCLLAMAFPAHAIPAFARKYGTSCLTCHVVFPKLTPFGEAFRRNGYRFPGVDSDYVKQGTVALGQEANKKTFPNSVWPASIPESVPLSVGANGQALLVPSGTSSLGRAPNSGAFSLQSLVAEGHLWAGAALDDNITLWAEITYSASDGTVDVEHAQILFNDLVGPKHLVNLVVGRGFSTVTPFGPHSSYVADQMVTNVPVTGIYGTSPNPWVLMDNYNGVEVNGVIAGRVGYSAGINAGADPGGGLRVPTENFYGYLGWKLGGMSLDGEGSAGPPDPLRPWAETALTLYAFGYRSNSMWSPAAPAVTLQNDVATTFGGGLRAQLDSLELNAGYYHDEHNHGTDTMGNVTAHVAFGELSYVLFPWMVPSLRVESAWLAPLGGPTVSDLHIMPGVAFLVRPNLRVIAVANWEHASGFASTQAGPAAWQGGAADWGSFSMAPPPNGNTGSVSEFESFAVFLSWAM